MKQITLRYPAKCKACDLTLRKGDPAVWNKRTKDVYCTRCRKDEQFDSGLRSMTDMDSQYEDACAERCGL